jgi:hypothetical protein
VRINSITIAIPARYMMGEPLVINDHVPMNMGNLVSREHPEGVIRVLGRFQKHRRLSRHGWQWFMQHGMTALPENPADWQTGTADSPIFITDDAVPSVYISSGEEDEGNSSASEA